MNGEITSVLLINNVTLASAGQYTCFAQFGNITARKDIYIAINNCNVYYIIIC